MNKNSGFTLIEVLLALSIIGMAMLGAIRVTESTTRNLRYIQDRTLAEWVAQNALISMKLRINGLQPAAGRWQSTMQMAGREWYWQAVTNPTVDPAILQITIEVSPDPKAAPIVTFVTYWPAFV